MKTILIISPGPSYNPHCESYQINYMELSNYYKGYIFTTSPKHECFDIGNFRYTSMTSKNMNIDTINYFIFCIWQSIIILIRGNKIDLVTTYDPLKTGIIGLIISFIHNAKFAPEINGVYTSPAEWLGSVSIVL